MKYVLAVLITFGTSAAMAQEPNIFPEPNIDIASEVPGDPRGGNGSIGDVGALSEVDNSYTQIGEQNSVVNYDQSNGNQWFGSVAGAYAPPLANTGSDTCYGSTTGGVSAPGFSLSGGKTYTDEHCNMLKSARMFHNLGLKNTALAVMCASEPNRKAMRATMEPKVYEQLCSEYIK